jgi:hypothetical protein
LPDQVDVPPAQPGARGDDQAQLPSPGQMRGFDLVLEHGDLMTDR